MIGWNLFIEIAAKYHEYDVATQRPDLLILTVLSAIAGGTGRNYCYPSQEKICQLLSRYGRTMSRRTLNRHLNALVKQGWVKRIRRHQRHPVRGMTFRSSLYTLTRRAFRWLAGMSAAVGRAVKWGKSFKRNSRVPDMAQHNPSRDIHTGRPPKSGGPPDPTQSVARSARAGEAKKHDNNGGTAGTESPGYLGFRILAESMRRGRK